MGGVTNPTEFCMYGFPMLKVHCKFVPYIKLGSLFLQTFVISFIVSFPSETPAERMLDLSIVFQILRLCS